MANCEFYVYLHRRLASGTPFYVGKGSGRRAQDCFSRNAHWKSIYAKDGGRTLEYIVRDVDEEFALLVEVELIDSCRRAGIRLANITSGGDGVTGMRHSEATKEKFRARVISEETRKKMSAAQIAFGRKGKPLSDNARAAAIAWHTGREGTFKGGKHTEETKAKMSAAWDIRRGAPMSPEARAKLGAASKGRVCSPETRAKMSATRMGMKGSPESTAKRLRTLAENKAKKEASTNG